MFNYLTNLQTKGQKISPDAVGSSTISVFIGDYHSNHKNQRSLLLKKERGSL